MLKKLAKIALLGTDRAGLSGSDKALLESQGIDTEADITQVLLEAAAVYGQRQKAGFPLKQYEGDLPESADDIDEYVCSENSAYHLQLILSGKFRLALPEFIACLRADKKQVPPEMLPEIIEQALASSESLEALYQIIGKRGKWLMRQIPEWQRYLPMENPELWATGNREERASVLLYLRQQFPDLAIEMLHSSWFKETPEDKLAYLEVLAENLRAEDESFLEGCLEEPQAEIRRATAVLLAQIKDSAFSSRLQSRVSKLLWSEDGKLFVQLPEGPNDAGLRDGLFVQAKVEKQGLRTAWFSQITALVAPDYWEKHLQLVPFEILEASEKTNFTMVLLGAFLSSILRDKNKRWAEAFLRFSIEKSDSITLSAEDTKHLLQVISQEQYNSILADYASEVPFYKTNSPLSSLLQNSTHFLHKETTLLLIGQLQKYISDGIPAHGNSAETKNSLHYLAFQCDFSELERLKKGWDMNSTLWSGWRQPVEEFIQVLQFRKTMTEGIF